MIDYEKRFLEIKEMRNKGSTYKLIGAHLCISYQRVMQITKETYPREEPNHYWDNKPQWKKEGRERTRSLVRQRDNFTCQSCGLVQGADDSKKERSLDVHHLHGLCGKKSRGYDSKKEITNLITLCHKCHYRRHDYSKRLDKTWKTK